jgi:hypothetical protein
MTTKFDPRAEADLDRSINTGVGNPFSPYNDVLLSQDDEQRMDDKGRLVVQGLKWSEAHSGNFMWIALWLGGHKNGDLTQLVPRGFGQTDIDLQKATLGHPYNISLGIAPDRARFNIPTVGACLELPIDLGDDPLKQQYVTEWIVETVTEALFNRRLAEAMKTSGDLDSLAVLIAAAAERAIGALL